MIAICGKIAKLRSCGKVHYRRDGPFSLRAIEIFRAEELGHALGRDALVHVALAKGGMTVRLNEELARLGAVCDQMPQSTQR